MTGIAAVEPLDRPRVLLAGDAAARPEGLERALTRAGFQVSEGECREPGVSADAVLFTTRAAGAEEIAALLALCDETSPRIILFAAVDPELPVTALSLGADDALAVPVHLPELCARIHARIRDRRALARPPYEREMREALQGLVAGARPALLPEEIVLALVRRLARAFDLAGCAFIIAGAGSEEGRIVAETGTTPEEGDRLDLGPYREFAEALRTGRPVPLATQDIFGWAAGGDALVLPVAAEEGTSGLLVMQQRKGSRPLEPAQLGLAASLAEAAARALEVAPAPSHNGQASTDALMLERRLQEEFERARRYSLSFSLVLLAIEALDGAGERIAGELRRLLRLPDFVSRYGESEFAIVLPETGSEGARRSIGRMRERLAALPPETLSAGIVSYPHPAVTQPDDMFALVEAALARGRVVRGRVGVAE